MTNHSSNGQPFLLAAVFSGLLGFSSFSTAQAYFGGLTGVLESQVKAACPAFADGNYKLSESRVARGNRDRADTFEHQTGARCICVRESWDKKVACNPSAGVPSNTADKR